MAAASATGDATPVAQTPLCTDGECGSTDVAKPGKKIYFAASIRGGRDDAPLYRAMIEHCKTHGQVMTEHIGQPSLEAMGETGVTEEYIYTRDVEWLKQSHCVIAEVTQPSLGVGYELGLAEALKIPIMCLFRPSSGRKLSAMIRGDAYMECHDYETLEEAQAFIDAYCAKIFA